MRITPLKLLFSVAISFLFSIAYGNTLSFQPVVLSKGDAQICVREAKGFDFLTAEDGDILQIGCLVRRPRKTSLELASHPVILFGQKQTVELFPGTLLRIEDSGVQLLLGRVHVFVTDNSERFFIRGAEAIFEIEKGEAWGDKDAWGNLSFALKKGAGWVKGKDRNIILLYAGKQVRIPRRKAPEKPTEIDDSWSIDIEGFAPIASLLQSQKPNTEIFSATDSENLNEE